MSTRSNIAIRVRPEDYARVNEKTGYTMTDETPYLEIYCHYDGYPEHMMDELPTYWAQYEKALELVLNGHTSSIYKGEQSYYTMYGESYERNKPSMLSKPVCYQEYLYVFDDGKWSKK